MRKLGTLALGSTVIVFALALPVAALQPEQRGSIQSSAAVDSALAAAKERFIKALGESAALKIDLTDRVTSMSAAELVQANQQSVGPAVEAFESLVKSYGAEFERALAPLRAEVRKQSDLAEQERSRGVRIFIGEPREIGGGYQGKFDGEFIYIETHRFKPEPIPGTIRLGPLDGMFVRDGSIEGTNALGAPITLRKFVDAPEVEQRKLEALTDRLWQYERDKERMLREATATHAAGFTRTYKAILDRAVALVERDSAALVEEAKSAAASPASEQRIADTAAALESVAWQAGIGAAWLERVNATLAAADAQFAKPRAELERSAESRLGEMAALLTALGTANNPLSDGHAARAVLAEITAGKRRDALLGRFDSEHDAYMERVRSGMGQRMSALAAQRHEAVGLKPIRDGLRVDYLGSDGDTVLVAAYLGRDAASRTRAERIGVLRLRDASVSASKDFTVDPREDSAWEDDARALVRPLEGGWSVVQHGRWSTFLPPGWSKTVSLPATSANDAWRLKSSVLAFSHGRPGVGFNRGVYAIKPDGEVIPLVDSPKDFALLDGRLVAVTTQGAGGGSDLVEVADALTGQPDAGFAAAWKRLNGYDPFGKGTQATIAGGLVWTFHPKGIEGISTGPTLVPIDPNGKFGAPLFGHTDYWASNGPERGAGQPVGSAKLAVRGAMGEIVIEDGRAYVYGTPRAGDTGGGSVVAFDLSTGKELWVEHDIRDQFNPVTEALRRRGEDGKNGPAFTLADAAARGSVAAQAHRLPFPVAGKPSLVEVTVSAEGGQPVTWFVLDDGEYARNVEGIDAGRVLRHGGYWYFGSDRIEIVRVP